MPRRRIKNPVVDGTDMLLPVSGPVAPSSHGRLVTFFRNGDPHYKGFQTSVSRRLFATIDTLSSWLAEKLGISGGVRYIFALPEGRRVKTLGEFVGGGSYVASSHPRVEYVPYGESKVQFWKNRRVSTTLTFNRTFLQVEPEVKLKDRKNGNKNTRYPNTHPSTSVDTIDDDRTENLRYARYGLANPRMLVIRSNTHRASQIQVLFNPMTVQLYEDLLRDLSNSLQMEHPPVTCLYTCNQPFRKVQGISHLLKGLRRHYEFFACGGELVPLELTPDPLPPIRHPHHQRLESPIREILPPKPSRVVEEWSPPEDDDPSEEDEERPRFQRPGANPWAVKRRRAPPLNTKRIENRSPTRKKNQPLDDDESPLVPVLSPPVLPLISYDPVTNQSYHVDRSVTMAPPPPPPPPSKGKTALGLESIQQEINGTLKEFFAPTTSDSREADDRRDSNRCLQLDWVYGYQGDGTRNNLHVLPSGELVYYIGRFVVIYNRRTHRQTHYTGHNNDISCVAVHVNGHQSVVATGQVSDPAKGSKSQIRVWDPLSLITMATIDAEKAQATFTFVDFSSQNAGVDGGHHLLALDDSEHHLLSVWNWKSRLLLAKTATSSSAVIGGSFHPTDQSLIVTYGEHHIYFWHFTKPKDQRSEGGQLTRDKDSGIFEVDRSIPKSVTALAFTPHGDVIVGTSDGAIIVWSKEMSSAAYVINSQFSEKLSRAHQRSVTCLHVSDGGFLLSAGGCDLKSWDINTDYTLLQTKIIPDRLGYITTLKPQRSDVTDEVLYLGTAHNNILRDTLTDSKCNYCVQGHRGDLSALDFHPADSSLVVSAGKDCSVSQWCLDKHLIQWRVQVEQPCLSVTYDLTGGLIAVGTVAGRFIVLTSTSGEYVTSVQAGSEPLAAVKFSPDGKFLAIGSYDGSIYVFQVLDDGRTYQRYQAGVLEGHVGQVASVDWSSDGTALMTSTADQDLKFWTVDDMKEASGLAMRDTDWFTQTSTIGYSVLGIWSKLNNSGHTISTVARSNDKALLATGDTNGVLALYPYPCPLDTSEIHRNKFSSEKIAAVVFSLDDRYVIAASGEDAAITQWLITDR